ncbi:MAG: GNAT family N-acetyltransferase [Akkermansiaceae bacterium]|nr:GNAT family N-acetyltransferase [Armatimonadota bacterium]
MSHEWATERLLLGALQPQDAPELFAIFSDPLTVEYTEWEPFQSISSAEWLIHWAMDAANQEPRTVFAWAIRWRSPEETKLLGIATLTVRNPSLREASVGYILDRASWGQGIATESARGVLDLAFRQLGLHRVTGSCCPENVGSVRVLEKIGMRYEGRLRQNNWEKGRWRDTTIYALLEHEVDVH